MKQLTAKILNTRIKQGWGYMELAQSLCCSVEQLKTTISNMGNRRAVDDFFARLNRNEQLKAQGKLHPQVKRKSSDNVTAPEAETTSDEALTGGEATAEEMSAVEKRPLTLSDVKSRILELEEAIKATEKDHKRVVAERGKLRDRLVALKTELAAIQSELTKKIATVESIKEALDETNADLIAICEKKKALEEEQAEQRQLFDVMSRLDLWLIGDELFDARTSDEVILPEEPADYQFLLELPEANSCPFGDLKFAAKLIRFVRGLEADYTIMADPGPLADVLLAEGVNLVFEPKGA